MWNCHYFRLGLGFSFSVLTRRMGRYIPAFRFSLPSVVLVVRAERMDNLRLNTNIYASYHK